MISSCTYMAVGQSASADTRIQSQMLEVSTHLENTTGLLINQAGDTLDTTTASQPSDGWLGNSLDVVT